MADEDDRNILFGFKYIKIVHNFFSRLGKTGLIRFDIPKRIFINSPLHFLFFFVQNPP